MTRRILVPVLLIPLLPARPAEPQFQLAIESKVAYDNLVRLWNNTLQFVSFDARSLPQTSIAVLNRVAGLASFPLEHIADYSLLVRRTEIVDDPDFQAPNAGSRRPEGDWAFPKLMTRMFRTMGQQEQAKIEGFFYDWAQASEPLNARWIAASPSRSLSAIPLRLLAVVNRLDQGRLINCPDRKVCGAEFRFVYAAITFPKDQPTQDATLKNAQDPYMTVSLEFVLPPLSRKDFSSLARSWMALSFPAIGLDSLDGLPAEGDPYAKPKPVADLERVLEEEFNRWSQPNARVFRMRTNLRLGGDWQMRQYSVDATRGFKAAPLDQETVVDLKKCVKKGSPLGTFIRKNQAAILNATHNFSTAGDCSGLATCTATLNEFYNTVLTLDKGIAPQSDLDKLRFSVSLDSCRGCHGMETRGKLPPSWPQGDIRTSTQFDQIKYREAGHASQLSPFLAGGAAEPSFIPWPVNPPIVSGCAGAPSAASRNYDDILRRLLFHLAVIIVPPNEWDATFERMQLTAFQTH